MQSVSDALATLHRDVSWFARAREHRCLVATVGGDLRAAALKVIAAGEVHADNRAAWVTLEDAMLAAEPGWAARSNRLVDHWKLRREAFAKEHVELPEVTVTEGDTPAAFAATLGAVLDALRAPLEGLVVVLAPTVVDGSPAIEPVLHALFEHPSLGRARWVLAVDESVAPFAALVGAPSLRCVTSRAVVDAATLDRDLDAIVSPAGGVAMPRGVTPPRRVDDPPPLPREKRDEALRAAGVDPASLDTLPALRTRVLGAAVAMKRGRGAEAITLQREARDLAASSGMHLAAALCSITLASYAAGLGERASALVELDDTTKRAAAHGLPLQEAEALLAAGMLHALDGRLPEASAAYARAGEAAERAEALSLAVEAWRLAGTIQMQAGDELAARSLQRAVTLAEGADPAVAKASSAAEAARMLAEIYARRGIPSAAASLHAQADVIERGEASA